MRVELKNKQDIDNMDDLRSLEKLQRGNENTQVQSLTEMVQQE
jgi:hypothetical protein